MAKTTKKSFDMDKFRKEANIPDYNSDDGLQFEVSDMENYRSDDQQVFNHQALVNEVLRRCNEAGSHEFRAGWFNEKADKSGNIIRTYIEDTREKFISCVKTAINNMSCDFDKTAKENIKELLKAIKEKKKELKKQQWEWYNKLSEINKKLYVNKIHKEFLNIEFAWYLVYKEFEVECHREILQELCDLTKRLDFYQAQDFEA